MISTRMALLDFNFTYHLAWGVNTLLGREVVRFSTEVPVKRMFAHLEAGGGVVLSGVFPLSDGRKLRHVVSLAVTLEEDGQIVGVIIDDPFGDWRTDYKNCCGNDVEINLEEFTRIFRPCGGNVLSGFIWWREEEIEISSLDGPGQCVIDCIYKHFMDDRLVQNGGGVGLHGPPAGYTVAKGGHIYHRNF